MSWYHLTVLLVSAAAALPAVVAVACQIHAGKPRNRFYEDVDGQSTPEAMARHSSRLPKALILLFAAMGVGASVAALVHHILHLQNHDNDIFEYALVAAAWVLALIHGICIVMHHSPVVSYRLGLLLFISSLVLTLPPIIGLVRILTERRTSKQIVIILDLLHLGAPISLALSAVALPRRPNVFLNGRLVDRQRTVSILSRYTWSWVHPLLHLASVKQDLSPEDVPCGDHRIRAEDLQSKWDGTRPRTTLLHTLLWSYKGRVALMSLVTVVKCLVSVMPFWAMHRVIGILENEGRQGVHGVELPSLVVIMALSNLLDGWMESWSYWYSVADIALPMRAHLTSLVFGKSLRRKDIRTPEKMKADGNEKKKQDDDEQKDSTGTEPETGSGQFVANLVGVDMERIERFCMYGFLLPHGILKLTIFSLFLVRLIGWVPYASGLLAWASVTLPANAWFSTRMYAQTTTLMRRRDDKLAQVAEALRGIRQIRFGALEDRWEASIRRARERELGALWRFFLLDTGLFACWVASPILLAATSLSVYAFVNGRLLPSVAFVSIGMFNTLELTLGSLPDLVKLGLEAVVSVRRIGQYLEEPEVVANPTSEKPNIEFDKASITWPSDGSASAGSSFTLRNLSISFPHGKLSVISGKTGTGKSLLISAILGEADVIKGSVTVPMMANPDDGHDNVDIISGSMAYVSQNPWLVNNATLRDNILFGLPLVQPRYNDVLEACALEHDLAALPDGDETEIGTNGANLSGGQQWRVTLARAVYSRAEILVMEDIFSAVDSHVGRSIFERCLAGDICRDRTRILVTHNMKLVLPETSYRVDLGPDGDDTKAYSISPQYLASRRSFDSASDASSNRKNQSGTATPATIHAHSEPSSSTRQTRKFTQEERREKGSVKAHVYMKYIKSCGGVYMWTACALTFLAYEGGIIGRSWWLRTWTSSSETSNPRVTAEGGGPWMSTVSPLSIQGRHLSYVDIYIIISAATAVLGTLRFFVAYLLAIRASRSVFDGVLSVVLRMPLQWLDAVPTGRIINRLTADFNMIDERITVSWTLFASHLLRVLGVCAVSLFVSPYLIPPAIIVFLAAGAMIAHRYLVGGRALKRLESAAKSPVFDLFGTTLSGVASIRAFRQTGAQQGRMNERVDAWTMTSFCMALTARWMSFRVALVAALFCTTVGVIVVRDPSVDAALAGFALSFVLDFAESLRWAIRCYGDMELAMNAMERATEYMELETERLTGEDPPAAWPTSGKIQIEDLEVSYAPDLPPVLKDLSLSIKHGERIGVVGRTGAGKSSLTLALLGFLQPRAGSIRIDGIDVSKVKLQALRSRLSIIPQDPILFSGTIRSNLDPFGEYTDAELTSSLARVHLINPDAVASTINGGNKNNSNIFQNLSSPVSESGGNLSQGQRQLLCIARAIVSQRKIIVLDEATSAVDTATDALIQHSIREGFESSTLFVIAHRLSTVADFDRILVLDGGRVAEYGTPRELWDKGGIFRGMCDSSGEISFTGGAGDGVGDVI